MPENIVLITVFTESSAVCALRVTVKVKAVKSMKKYLMLTKFKLFW
jgi:hypothetical protein